ncbi:unnamed protein product [Leuciscus chuanchicus]
MAHGRRSNEVAWPSGLRRWIKAPVSSGAWFRIPPLPRQPFRRHLCRLCLSEKAGEVTLLAPGLFQTQLLLLSLAELSGPQSLTTKEAFPPVEELLQAFLGRTQWASEPDDEENGPRKVPRRGSVAEGSKALDLGSSLFRGVGSNPTAASSGFKEGPTP